MKRILVLVIPLISFLHNCGTQKGENQLEIDQSAMYAAIETISPKKILFGHASVGYNIVSGLEKLVDDHEKLTIFEIKEASDFTHNGFYHKMNGKNFDPKSKCDAFRDFLNNEERGNQVDIAFFKFCFVDFDENSNVQAVFDYYVETCESIKSRFKNLTLLHVTTPLTTHVWGIKGYVRNLMKTDMANVKRNQFNQLLREKYQGKEPIFDLAETESTLPDGRQASFLFDGQPYFYLDNSYTFDGGHLNEFGSLNTAKALLQVLAQVAATSQ